MLRVLLDTNIYISAILFKGKPRLVFQDLIDEVFTGYISKEILDELESTLSKPKFKLDNNFIQIVLSEIRDITTLVKNKPIQDYLELRDRDDYHILESAFAAKVDYLITGDKDLLTLQKIKDFKIITPDEYLSLKERNET
ncbi:putative toxin-antitoxin system toxin component, PIN family [Leptospira alstonii]|uniref:putative toxin-antitoxin system toxin component, PIN family n=1 Tax=Leptospira alstonii TaxID=28452 RepID=UPI000772FC22|nr:putative toxin-antitoxin system toxin component, PIN family [Leptospira alstonii]